MFYLTKEAHIHTHTNPHSPSLSPPFLSSFPSPILGEHSHTHTHMLIRTSHMYTLSSLNTHTHTYIHAHTHRDQPAAICSTRSVQSSQNTLFTTIHHITFPQCHSLVLEKSEGENGGERRAKQLLYSEEREKQKEREGEGRFGLLHGTVVEKIKGSLIWLSGETRLSAKLVPVTATRLD